MNIDINTDAKTYLIGQINNELKSKNEHRGRIPIYIFIIIIWFYKLFINA